VFRPARRAGVMDSPSRLRVSNSTVARLPAVTLHSGQSVAAHFQHTPGKLCCLLEHVARPGTRITRPDANPLAREYGHLDDQRPGHVTAYMRCNGRTPLCVCSAGESISSCAGPRTFTSNGKRRLGDTGFCACGVDFLDEPLHASSHLDHVCTKRCAQKYRIQYSGPELERVDVFPTVDPATGEPFHSFDHPAGRQGLTPQLAERVDLFRRRGGTPEGFELMLARDTAADGSEISPHSLGRVRVQNRMRSHDDKRLARRLQLPISDVRRLTDIQANEAFLQQQISVGRCVLYQREPFAQVHTDPTLLEAMGATDLWSIDNGHRWLKSESLVVTIISVRSRPLGQYVPAGFALTMGYNAQQLQRVLLSLRDSLPCRDETCACPFSVHPNADGHGWRLSRNCNHDRVAGSWVQAQDKASVLARVGRAAGASVTLCDFHSVRWLA
jgi:hypothetical protein